MTEKVFSKLTLLTFQEGAIYMDQIIAKIREGLI